MAASKKYREHCTIGFRMRYKGEDVIRSGMKEIWLVFQARKTETENQKVIRESTEIPIPANVIGTTLAPQRDNPTHINIHQNLLQSLQADGWELLPHQGGEWWERRLRRGRVSSAGS
jgi:hypothetical protein